MHPEGDTVSAPDERQEFFSGLWILPEYPQHCAGHCFTVHFLYPTHYHAHVPRRNERGVSAAGTPLEKEQSHGERRFLHCHTQFWEGSKTSTARKGTCCTSAVGESHSQPLSAAFSLIPGKSQLPEEHPDLMDVPAARGGRRSSGQGMDLVQLGQLLTATSPQRIRQHPL